MPRYLVERTFAGGLQIPANEIGAKTCSLVVERNAESDVTWLHSCVTEDKGKTYSICDGPYPEAIRKAATYNGLLVDRITQVAVLDPYFYY